METIQAIKALLAQPQKIVLTTHHNPDGDAVGSALAMYHFLTQLRAANKKKHEVRVIVPNDYPQFLHWVPGDEKVIAYEKKRKLSREIIQDATIVFCLDFNQLKRLNDLGMIIEGSEAIKIMIDHHRDPGDFAKYQFWNHHASSTCELVYEFISLMGHVDLINKDVATCLYVGIMTDTGSFRFSSTSSKVHHITADLIDRGVNNTHAHEMIYDSFSEDRLRLFGYCFSEKLQVFPAYRTALISLTQDELKRFKAGIGDTEGLVNYGLAIEGIKLAVLITDRGHIIKLSLRSKGTFPANEMASKYFDGGGHLNAAGGSSSQTLEETIEKFISILPEYETLLNKDE